MAQIWVREFTGGVDSRRLVETAPGGTLIEGVNGHITRGGEFEERFAFVKEYPLPPGTVGMAAGKTAVTVFGSTTEPGGIPVDLDYQELAPPVGESLVAIKSADRFSGKLYVAAEFSDGSLQHHYDAALVDDWADGRARASFRVTGGTGASSITALTVGGVSVISTSITWTTSNEATAEDVADAINSNTSSPDWEATFNGDQVIILAPDAGAAYNGQVVSVTTASGFAITPSSGIETAGGTDPTDTYQPGEFVKTIGSKMYALSGPNMHFSGVAEPTKFTTDVTGAGFIDLSTWASGSETLQAIAKYQNSVAVFSSENIQIWYVDPDPTLNRQVSVLNNTGTESPQSVTQFGDNDIFYLAESGLRSLQARDSSNAAATADIGNPIDVSIITKLASLTETERKRVVGLIEPRDGRFWLIMKDVIFVLSYFPGSKVSAWTTYEPGFDITDACVFNRRVYVRSGDDIYVYGGASGAELDDSMNAVARLPYMDGNDPTRGKRLTGIDVAVRGTWEVRVGMDYDNLDALDFIATADKSTFKFGRVEANADASHFSLHLTSTGHYGAKPAKFASAVIHYESDADEDKT